jgi:hypothetical protein
VSNAYIFRSDAAPVVVSLVKVKWSYYTPLVALGGRGGIASTLS